MDMDLIGTDEQVRDLAKKALEAQKSEGFWGLFVKAAAALAILIGFFAIRYALMKKSKELAEARTKLEQQQLQARVDAAQAKAEPLVEESEALYREATAKIDSAERELKLVKAKEAAFETLKERIEKVSNWEDLESIAGVTP